GGPIAEEEIGPEAQEADVGRGVRSFVTGAMSWARTSADHIPRVDGSAFTNLDAGFSGFNGLTHRDSRLADNGNQFSVEPPDQGLAVGAGFVVEVVNKAVAAYDTNGNLLAGPTALNPFFGAPSAIVRGTPNVFGPFFSDPKAYFDPAEHRFFVTIAEQDVDTA